MKAYVITSGAIFALVTIAHLARVFVERHLITDPFFILTTLLSAGLSIWAWRTLRRLKR